MHLTDAVYAHTVVIAQELDAYTPHEVIHLVQNFQGMMTAMSEMTGMYD